MYPGDTSERQGSKLHMVKKEEGKKKQQLTGPEPVISRSIADPSAAWAMVAAGIYSSIPP